MIETDHEVAPRPQSDCACSFGVVLTWPKIKNAEYEVVKRFERAATNLGVYLYVLDNDGYPLWSNRAPALDATRRVTRADCEFVVSLHFESPRLYDIPSYSALWNPSDYFVGFGYERTILQFASHSDVLSCDSEAANAHGLGIYLGLGRALPTPLPLLFHSVPGPYPEPKISKDSRLFYIGINWERIGGQKGRHQELLERLDKEDLIYIYGPDLFNGVRPWEDFANYRGPIPFDGESVVARINEAGICLAFSSEPHQKSGIMSNRLFEALAAGAVIVANTHPFIDKHFSDCVYVIDDRLSAEEQNEQIRRIVLEIRGNPVQARERARRGQDRFKASFTLEACLSRLIDGHPDRCRQIEARQLGAAPHSVTVILNYTGHDASVMDRMLDDIGRQVFVSVHLVIICDEEVQDACGSRWSAKPGGAVRSTRVLAGRFQAREARRGSLPKRLMADGVLFDMALSCVDTEFFCTMQEDDHWFSDHLATLAGRLHAAPGSDFSCSGRIIEVEPDPADRPQQAGLVPGGPDETQVAPRRHLDALSFQHLEAMAEVHYPRDVGRFLYRTSLIERLPRLAVQLLDGMQHRLLALWALLETYPVQTNYASYVWLTPKSRERLLPFFSEMQQCHIIRDTVRGDNRWFELCSALRQYRPSLVQEREQPDPVSVGRLYDLRLKGDGVAYLRDGFSAPEGTATWIDGLAGVLEFAVGRPAPPGPLDLLVVALGRPGDGAPQVCTVVMQGLVIGRIELTDTHDEFRLSIPDTIDLQGTVAVTFRILGAEPVRGPSNEMLDKRRLGMQVARFGVLTAKDPLVVGRLYGLCLGGEAVEFLGFGFSRPETRFAWIDGRTAVLELSVPSDAGLLDLVLIASGRADADGARQSCTILANGNPLGVVPVEEDESRLCLAMPLPRSSVPLKVQLTLYLRHATPVCDPDGVVLDSRELGMRIMQVGVFTSGSDRPS